MQDWKAMGKPLVARTGKDTTSLSKGPFLSIKWLHKPQFKQPEPCPVLTQATERAELESQVVEPGRQVAPGNSRHEGQTLPAFPGSCPQALTPRGVGNGHVAWVGASSVPIQNGLDKSDGASTIHETHQKPHKAHPIERPL